ncbi:glycoside hydrolase family 16 protein [Sphingomonas koreensis]
MFAMFALAMQSTLSATNVSADVPMAAPATKPSFADEFDGPHVDTGKWLFDTHRNKAGWYNNELQYYADGRPENVRVEGGALVIEVRREALRKAKDWGGQAYTSAKLVTRQRYGYGFYEIRAKLPCGRGMWPAIWMLPTDGKWPDGGEIDIMEMVGWDANVIHATVHSSAFYHVRGTQRGAQAKLPTACTQYHNYQLDWRPGSITIGIDGRGHMQVKDDQPGGAAAWPFTRSYELILNLAVGGDWGGQKGVDDAALPQRMQVDYVRYWAAPTADAGSPGPAARPAE